MFIVISTRDTLSPQSVLLHIYSYYPNFAYGIHADAAKFVQSALAAMLIPRILHFLLCRYPGSILVSDVMNM